LTRSTKCMVPGCEALGNRRGLCNRHRLRKRRHGDPLTVLEKGRPAREVRPGARFGQLLVVREVERPSGGERRYRCECLRCGSERDYLAKNLLSGGATSCGCNPRCALCGASLRSHRGKAVWCGPAHRREGARIRRLIAGKAEGFYGDLEQYLSRHKRANRGSDQSGLCQCGRCDVSAPRGVQRWICTRSGLLANPQPAEAVPGSDSEAVTPWAA
jgi:hypothetical protein